MTTLDDKLLGEKLQYYYSSSEDEGSDNEDAERDNKTIRDANVEEPEIDHSADGSAVNTGPKGVINDWRKYKQVRRKQIIQILKEYEIVV
uniref:Phosducin domain-containing protein n=1 Tax=Tetraodon nigroviridis TaxID=99883 RepID=H3C1H4_TETNG